MEHLPMRTSIMLSIAAALATVAVASSDEASARSRGGDGGGDRRPSVNIRDHRAPKTVNIRDHRTPKPVSVRPERPGFVWVQKKGQSGHWERPRAEAKSVPVIRDHRKPATPVVRDHRKAAPVVRDHRGTVRYTERKGTASKKPAAPHTPMPLNVPTGR
jgi:hypothetical protein